MRIMPLILPVFVVAALSLPTARAQTAESGAGAIVINGLTVQKRQDLDFGTIAPSLTQSGTVRVNRGADRSSQCSAQLTCLSPGTRARFSVFGMPFYTYTISMPATVTLNGPNGASMTASDFFGAGSGNDISWKGLQTINKNGKQSFNVGGVLTVGPNQPPGVYTGVFTVTVEYQ